MDVTQRLLSGHRAFYDLVWRGDADAAGAGQDGPVFFAHSRALLEGDYRPCFYCGARRHPASDCPSKHLLYRTRGLAGLGRLSIGEINERFAQYLDSAEGERLSVPADADIDMVDPVYLVPLAFYELRKAFQIRFMNVIWSASPRDEWYKVREVGRETSAKGGVLWIARDCIRVSDLNEAEKLLMRYGRQNRDDYRAACGLAFIKMEREEYRDACDLFHEALEQAVSPAQKTYLHLLMSRIWELLEKRDKSLEALKEAIRIEPYCLEAKFEDAARHFQLGRQTDGLNRLIKLLKLSHEFYLPALISPELAEFRPAIASELDKLRVEGPDRGAGGGKRGGRRRSRAYAVSRDRRRGSGGGIVDTGAPSRAAGQAGGVPFMSRGNVHGAAHRGRLPCNRDGARRRRPESR